VPADVHFADTRPMTHAEPSPAAEVAPSGAVEVPHDDPANAAAWVYDQATTNPRWNFGTKARPNAELAKAQADMGGIAADGIYGPATKARGKQLIGRTFPARR
jgi:hypothetical protein